MICKKICLSLVAVPFLLASCKNEDKLGEEISKIPIDIQIIRFDNDFAKAKPSDLEKLKRKYPYFFSTNFSDSLWLAKISSDTLQHRLENEIDRVFNDFEPYEAGILGMFQHMKYYFPSFRPPNIVTVVSEVDYNRPVVLTDSLIIIGLDNYLGSDHEFYAGLPNYVSQRLDPTALVPDVAASLSKTVNAYPNQRSFLAKMIYYGKELYLKSKILPNEEKSRLIGYDEAQWQWAQDNEEQIWRHVIDNDILYSTNNDLERRYLDPAPFTKFGLVLDSESPGRLGRYIGWQIVEAFMSNNDEVGLVELLSLAPRDIFDKSNYKPRR